MISHPVGGHVRGLENNRMQDVRFQLQRTCAFEAVVHYVKTHVLTYSTTAIN
jgi:hypothetical protein